MKMKRRRLFWSGIGKNGATPPKTEGKNRKFFLPVKGFPNPGTVLYLHEPHGQGGSEPPGVPGGRKGFIGGCSELVQSHLSYLYHRGFTAMASMKNYQEDPASFSKGLLVGILTGGAVGAALALLYAPKSGRELRGEIAEKANGYVDKTADAVNNASERARQIVNEGRKRAENIIEDAREKASSLLTDAERIVTDARAKAQKTVTKASDDVKEGAEKLADATRAGMHAFKDELRNDPKPPIAGDDV